MNWIHQKLHHKFVLGTASGLIISSLVFLLLFISLYKQELKTQQKETLEQVNYLLQLSLENAMLQRDRESLQQIMSGLGEKKNIIEVSIANPNGLIVYSSNLDAIDKPANYPIEFKSSSNIHFTKPDHKDEVIRSINTIDNQERCTECHDPVADAPFNGALIIDYNTESIKENARNTTLFLMSAGAIIVILNLIGGWWFISRFILHPVEKLSEACNTIAQGKLDTRIAIKGKDELALLAQTFNQMSGNIQQNIEEIEEHKNFLQALVDAIPDGIRIIDQQHNIILYNQAYEKQLACRHKEKMDASCFACHGRQNPCAPSLTTCPIEELKSNNKPLKFIHQHKRNDNTAFPVEIYAAPMWINKKHSQQLLVVESIRDLEAAAKYSHQEKLSQLGRLAAGISHEINNPMTSIKMILQASLSELEEQDFDRKEIKNYLQIVDKEINSCVNVLQRLLKLSAPPSSQPEAVYIKPAIEETLSLLNWEAEQLNISIKLSLGENNYRVVNTDSEIRMVILNMTLNAFNAMPEGGNLEIRLNSHGNRIHLFFIDNGIGIQSKNLPFIFDPFFSRRKNGTKGSGLGLSICRSIVENYQGDINVSTAVGEGTTFRISLLNAEMMETF